MKVLEQLFVVWQDPESCSYFPVGHLKHVSDKGEQYYEFTYIKGVRDAIKYSFKPFLAFPEYDETYLSKELFSFFKNRILSNSRSDYIEYVSNLGLSPDDSTPIEILARSGGRRMTDSVELFCPPKSKGVPSEGFLVNYFFLAHGLRHMRDCAQGLVETLESEARLFIMHDLQNPVDNEALILRTEDYCCVGFLPRYLLPDCWEFLKGSDAIKVFIEKLNPPPAPIQQRILCRMEANTKEGFQPCSSYIYGPFVSEDLNGEKERTHQASIHPS
ncbi:MAG: DNA-binding protein [Planctomycetes bacterium]|nr:DNA-binding protein [Planctomycetota bacterium]